MTKGVELNEKKVKNFVIIVSITIPLVVAALYFLPEPTELDPETLSKFYILPKLNAIFNGTAFLCLIAALAAVKKKNINRHRAFTTAAMVLSVLFLVSYVAFHSMVESTSYGGEGGIRYLYFFILISHILLSAIIVPLVLFTYARGLAMKVEKHRKLAKITFPIWLYVTLTGVIVYLMISPYYPH